MSPLFAFLIAATPVHLHVEGDGYLRLMRDGRPVYSREADLTVIGGLLGTKTATFLPAIRVSSLSNLHIDLMGNVDAAGTRLGRLVLAMPASPGQPDGTGFFTFADRPTLTSPGEGVAGVVRLDGEQSNTAPAAGKAAVPKPTATATRNSTTPAHTKRNLAKLEVIVHFHSEVGSEPFKLSDIAELKGPEDLVKTASDLVVANAPALGIKRILDSKNLALLLRGAGIEPTETIVVCPLQAEVIRRSQTISVEALTAKAQEAVLEKFGGSIPLVCDQKVAPLITPEGEITLSASQPELVGAGYFVTVTALVGGEPAGVRTMMLTPSKDAPRVRANDLVTVALTAGSASIELMGRVKTAGYVGQRIEVVIDGVGEKQTVHIGTLVSIGRVEVQV